MLQIYISELVIIGLGNSLPFVGHKTITLTNADLWSGQPI